LGDVVGSRYLYRYNENSGQSRRRGK
jgi:hypothetical protein